MFAFIARRQYLGGLAALERGASDELLTQFDPACEFTVVGRSPLGARLRSHVALCRWSRLHSCSLGRASRCASWPWAMHLAARVAIRSTAAGEPYENQFAQFLRIQWGRVVWDYVLEDTQRFEDAVARLATVGVAEATADPIRDIPRLEDQHAA